MRDGTTPGKRAPPALIRRGTVATSLEFRAAVY